MENIRMYITDYENKQVLDECKTIAIENLACNGGTLHYPSIVYSAEYIIFCVNEKDEIISYLALNDFGRELYVTQVAVSNNYKRLGLASKMYKYYMSHSKGCPLLSADVRADNTNSYNLHLKMGFKASDVGYNGLYRMTLDTRKIKNNEYIPIVKRKPLLCDSFKINKINNKSR